MIGQLIGFTDVEKHLGAVHILYKHARGRGVREMLMFSYVSIVVDLILINILV